MQILNSIKAVLLIVISAFVFACSPSNQNDISTSVSPSTTDKGISVKDSWARATFAMAQTGAIYLSIENSLETDVVLVSATVAQEIAQEVQLHDMGMNDGMMQMVELVDGVKISAGKTAQFAPGGKHVMLLGLQNPLVDGKSVSLTLNFMDQAPIQIQVPIKDARNL